MRKEILILLLAAGVMACSGPADKAVREAEAAEEERRRAFEQQQLRQKAGEFSFRKGLLHSPFPVRRGDRRVRLDDGGGE